MNQYNLVAENTHLPAGEAGSTVVAEYYKSAGRNMNTTEGKF